jgi:hypothetical protein
MIIIAKRQNEAFLMQNLPFKIIFREVHPKSEQ